MSRVETARPLCNGFRAARDVLLDDQPTRAEPSLPPLDRIEPARFAPVPGRAGVKAMTAYDSTSFSAGQDCGTRIAACVARVAALDLIDDARWWNRRRRREMARALFACAEELESAADADRRGDPAEPEGESIARIPRRLTIVTTSRPRPA
jgi:hypothetical protein